MNKVTRIISQVIFMGRWLQAPLYLGLIVILGAYVYSYLNELLHLMGHFKRFDDSEIMLGVLDLIDIVMLANLLIMVTIGGYETFVSHLHLHDHPDKPEWLGHIDAGAMKVKLALSLIGISSIHLLRTFIDPSKYSNSSVMWQVLIHLTLLVSAITIAFTNKIMHKDEEHDKDKADTSE
jgi:uncharacterized protein (TIGR00645 family)